MNGTLGRRVPTDWKHVEKFRFATIAPVSVTRAERTLPLPRYRLKYDQGTEGACVGFGSSWMTSILNRSFYDAPWLWDRAKERDEWADTNPGDGNGTSVRAAMDVLRLLGHVKVWNGASQLADQSHGIAANRWATQVDEVRTCVAAGTPVVLGVNWYVNFDHPVKKGTRWWIGEGALGNVRGGHAVCIYSVKDSIEAVGIVNNWGIGYPLAMLPYTTLQRLLDEQGEATMVTDR